VIFHHRLHKVASRRLFGNFTREKIDVCASNAKISIQGSEWILRGMKRNARCTKEVFMSYHKNNVIFLWLATPKFFYVILFRAVRGPIVVIFNKINRAVYF
jgi:hypothetical protein